MVIIQKVVMRSSTGHKRLVIILSLKMIFRIFPPSFSYSFTITISGRDERRYLREKNLKGKLVKVKNR